MVKLNYMPKKCKGCDKKNMVAKKCKGCGKKNRVAENNYVCIYPICEE